MSVTDLLLKALDSLGNDEFTTFKWRLSNKVLDGCTPIPGHHLETAQRTDTVTKLVQSYGDDTAVTITLKVLRKMNQNAAALALETAYKESEEGKATSSTTSSSSAAPGAPAAAPAVPSTVSADRGGVVFAPIVKDTKGDWNITIHKS